MANVQSRIEIKVLIADDHAIFRDGLRRLLNSEEDIAIVGEARNGAECIQMLGKLKPDILLLDLHMPDKNGFTVLKEVNIDTILTHIIVLTAVENDRDLIRAMRLGARGIVPKKSAIDLLVTGIHHVHAGEIWVDSHLTARVINAFSALSKSLSHIAKPLLSDREMEVVQLVAQGFRNKEIGKKLSIREQTVKNYLHSIFDKFGVYDRVELALYAINQDLIDRAEGTLALIPFLPRTHKPAEQNTSRF
jgi:DNA-binding NarL/FixJ family response regulator